MADKVFDLPVVKSALSYLEQRWAIFPLKPATKEPLTAHGFHDASKSATCLDGWWGQARDAGIAIATGRVSGIVVVDIDPRNDGHLSFEALEKEFGALPPTIEGQTGGGGRHLFFQHPGGLFPSVKGWRKGIDIKSDGGYVVAPPSTHPNGGHYAWKPGHGPGQTVLTPLPTWLHAALTDARKKAVEEVSLKDPATGEKIIPEGARNDALTSLAGTMQRRGMSYEAILRALIAENEVRCKPPLSEAEVEKIAKSVGRYAPEDDRFGVDASTPDGVRLDYESLAHLIEPPPINWLLADRIAFGDCCIVAGPPAAGKSWFTYEVGVAGAVGGVILNVFPVLQPLRVLMIDEENPRDEVLRRLWLLAKAHNVHGAELAKNLKVARACQGFNFRDPAYVYGLQKEVEEFQPDVIIFDSLIAISTIQDEADAVQVRQFFNQRIHPLRSICNSTMIFIHHTNKSAYLSPKNQPYSDPAGQVRGSIDFLGAVDSLMMIRKQDKVFEFHAAKVRRGEQPPPITYRLQQGLDGGLRPVAPMEQMDPREDGTEVLTKEQLLEHLRGAPRGADGWIPVASFFQWLTIAVPKLNQNAARTTLYRLRQAGEVESRRLDEEKGRPVFVRPK